MYLREFKPGEEYTVAFDISRMFDMTLTGKYTITSSRTVSVGKTQRFTTITSNAVEVVVDERVDRETARDQSLDKPD